MEQVVIELEEEDISEKDYILEVYDLIISKQRRSRETGIYRLDFCFEMIKTHEHLWMDKNHPVSSMLESNQFEPVTIFIGPYGNLVVYHENVVEKCIDTLMVLCKTHNLIINENEG